MATRNAAATSVVVRILAHASDQECVANAVEVASQLGLRAEVCEVPSADPLSGDSASGGTGTSGVGARSGAATSSDVLNEIAQPRRVLLVFISRTALSDDAFVRLATAGANASTPTLPVLVDPVSPGELPPAIAKHNWLDAAGLDSADMRRELHRVLATDPAAFLYFQDFVARADRWERSGELEDALLSDVGQVRAAARRLDALAESSSLAVTDALAKFLAASLAYGRRVRRKRIRQWGRRIVIGGLAVAAIVVGRNHTNQLNQLSLATLQTQGTSVRLQLDPNFYTFRAIQDASSSPYTGANIFLIRGLQRPWLSAVLTSDKADWIGPGLFSDPKTLWTEMSGGRLIRWDVTTGEPRNSWQVADGRFRFAIQPGGESALIATEAGSFVHRPATASRTPAQSTLSIYFPLAAGQTLGAGVVDRDDVLQVATVDLATGQTRRISHAYDQVYDLTATEDGLRALVRDGDDIVLLDIEAGRDLARAKLPDVAVHDGRVGRGGDQFVLVCDGALYVGEADGLRSAGYTAREATTGLDLTTGGLIVVATPQDGVRVIEPRSMTELGRICLSEIGTSSVTSSPDGMTVACNNGFTTEVWRLDTMAPSASPPQGAAVSRMTRAHADQVEASITEAGQLTLSIGAKTWQTTLAKAAPMASGTPTVVNLTGDGRSLLVGTDEGWVAAFDVSASDPSDMWRIQQWRAPTGAAVQAAGWSDDGRSLAVLAAGQWFSPISCRGCSDTTTAIALARDRQPPCWRADNLVPFSTQIKDELGMAQCRAIPEPEG